MRHKMIEIQTPEARRRRKLIRIAIIVTALLLLPPVIFAFYTYESNDTVKEAVGAYVRGSLPPDKAFPGRDHITMLLLGRDVDINNHGQLMKTRGRSDTIILIRVDFAKKQMRLMSIPRDTATRIPGYRGISKINAAHAFGGPELAVQTVQNLVGVPIDYYVVVNYSILAKSIDDLGGVTVYVDKNLDYDDNWGNLHIHLKKGMQHLNGREAIGFVRFRHSNFRGQSDTDFSRMGRQQRLLQALMGSLSSPRVLIRVPGVLDGIRRDLVTTLSTDQLMSLAYFAKGIPHDSVVMKSLPSREGPVFVYMDRDETRKLVEELFEVAPGGFPVATAPTYDEVKRLSERVIRHRQEMKRSGAPDADQWEEPAVPEPAPAAGADVMGPQKDDGAAPTATEGGKSEVEPQTGTPAETSHPTQETPKPAPEAGTAKPVPAPAPSAPVEKPIAKPVPQPHAQPSTQKTSPAPAATPVGA